MLQSSRVAILVKALPQPSKTYGETVCCAGVTHEREWKRLFPVRYRHLREGQFSRWDWVRFDHHKPTRDARVESCHVHEESVRVEGRLRPKDRISLLSPLIVGSAKAATLEGRSLALIRPRNTRFIVRPKSAGRVEEERAAYRAAASQTDIFDQELAALDPSPFEFRFQFEDEDGPHNYANGDWEAHAMFWRETRRTSETEALRWMQGRFNDEYPAAGMVFAIGNLAKRPHTWQLLGVLRLDEPRQGELIV